MKEEGGGKEAYRLRRWRKEEGDCEPARLVQGELILGGALGSVENSGDLGDRAPT